jgi:hypothetical protein
LVVILTDHLPSLMLIEYRTYHLANNASKDSHA